MNKTTQYHIGAILTAIAAFGQHLMGSAGEQTETPAVTAEPTDQPKRPGRPRKEPTPATTEPHASSSAPAEKPAEPPAEKPANAMTWEQLKDLGRPMIESGMGEAFKAIIKKHIPDTGNKDGGLRELANHPQAHAAFAKDVEAASY